jgi:hypothetical protein
VPATVKRRVPVSRARKIAHSFGVTCTPMQVARLGVWGESKVYEMLRAGTFPVDPIRVGARYEIPTAPLLKFLGLED